MPTTRPPLAGFRVLDLTRVRTGPTAVKQLADWGADVIKIERPPGGDDMGGPRHGSDFQNLHRNKRSMTLDLKHPEALALFLRMAVDADVVVENYRPAVKHRLGVDYESLRPLNPRLVYASISGFGQEGPYADRAGVDQIAQGLGGLMSVTGPEGGGVPLRVGIPIADLCGGLYCALGILTALLERERSGEGQWVRTSLLQAQVAMMDLQAMRWLMDEEIPAPVGNGHPTGSPTNAYRTRDGYVNVGASGGDLFARFCRAIERPDLLEDPDYATEEAAYRNRHALDAIVEERLRTETTAHWVERLNAAGVPCGPIHDMRGVFEDPQVRHLGTTLGVDHPVLGDIDLVGPAFDLSRSPMRTPSAAPDCGAHTDAILAELGLGETEVAKLRASGAI